MRPAYLFLTRLGLAGIFSTCIGAASAGPGETPFWSYSAYASLGSAGAFVRETGGKPEIWLTQGTEFLVLQWQRDGLVETAARPHSPLPHPGDGLTTTVHFDRIQGGELDGQVFHALSDGRIAVYDRKTKERILFVDLTAEFEEMQDCAAGDIDRDGSTEFICTGEGPLHVKRTAIFSKSGVRLSELNYLGDALAVGQVDRDRPLEIVGSLEIEDGEEVAKGYVVDGKTLATEWAPSGEFGFGLRIQLVNADADDELEILAHQYSGCHLIDVGTKQVIRGFAKERFGSMFAGNMDSDPELELIVGDGERGLLRAYELTTGELIWSMENPDYGVDSLVAGDFDGDGAAEFVWSSGAGTSEADYVRMSDFATRRTEWQSPSLSGLIGPAVGDVDGDAKADLVMVSHDSQAQRGGGRILVFDAQSHRLKGISGPNESNLFNDVCLRNVQGDGTLEILTAGEGFLGRSAQVYTFRNGVFTLLWTSPNPTDGPFHAIDAADLDGDGKREIVCQSSTSLVAFRYSTGAELWTGQRVNSWREPYALTSAMEIGQFDADPALEIASVRDDGTLFVFDGSTHKVQQRLRGNYTCVTPDRGKRGLFAGTERGVVRRFRFDGSALSLLSSLKVGRESVTALTYPSEGVLFAASTGVISQWKTATGVKRWKTALTASSTGLALFQSGTGKKVLFSVRPGRVNAYFTP